MLLHLLQLGGNSARVLVLYGSKLKFLVFSFFAAKNSGMFTVEVIHGGFFFCRRQNRCYLDG